jgi:hypothetical protein
MTARPHGRSTSTSSPLQVAVRVPSHVIRRDFAAETVLLNLNTGKYHGLSPTAGRMLAVLQEVGNVAAAAGRISSELERPLAEIEREIAAFCRSLADRDLIEIEHAGSPASASDRQGHGPKAGGDLGR